MNKKEFSQLVMALRTYYPRENILPNEQAMELWFFQLQDIPYEVAQAGLNKWVAINKWSPSIADIRDMSTGIIHGDIPSWSEAWEDVMRAVSRFGYYGAQEAMQTLSPLTRQATERIGFVNICRSENISADRANFRMIYEQLAERKKKDYQIPEALRQLISGMTEKNKIEEGTWKQGLIE